MLHTSGRCHLPPLRDPESRLPQSPREAATPREALPLPARLVAQPKDEAGVEDAELQCEAKVEDGWVHEETVGSEITDAGGEGRGVEDKGAIGEEREGEEEREGLCAEAAEAGHVAWAQAVEAKEHQGAGSQHEDECWDPQRRRRRGRGLHVSCGWVGVVGLVRGMRMREEGLAGTGEPRVDCARG